MKSSQFSPHHSAAQQPILEDGNQVDGQTHLITGLACFKHARWKEGQLSLLTGVHWERWPHSRLEN